MARFEMRDGTSPDFLPEVELDASYNDNVEEPYIEIFLDEPINTPDSDIMSPRLVLTLDEAWTLWHGLARALGPNPSPTEKEN